MRTKSVGALDRLTTGDAGWLGDGLLKARERLKLLPDGGSMCQKCLLALGIDVLGDRQIHLEWIDRFASNLEFVMQMGPG